MLTPTRLTNAAPSWMGNEYSSMCPFNSDNSKVLVIDGTGSFNVYDFATKQIKRIPVLASEEPRWSRSNASILYHTSYSSPNQVFEYNVVIDVSRSIRTFPEYTKVYGRGESDISSDGQSLVLSGDDREIFTFNVLTGVKGAAYKWSTPFDGLKLSPGNHIILSAPEGLFVLDPGPARKICNANGHCDVGSDTNGDPIIVWTNSADPSPVAACQNGIVKVRIADGKQTCLLQLDWSLAVHISLPDNKPWCLVSTYAPVNKGKQYTNQILKVMLDGSGVEVLCNTNSKPLNSYNWTPKVSVSNDGSRFVFSSNNGFVPTGATAEYIDVWYAELPAAAVTPPTNGPLILSKGAKGTWEVDANGNLILK